MFEDHTPFPLAFRHIPDFLTDKECEALKQFIFVFLNQKTIDFNYSMFKNEGFSTFKKVNNFFKLIDEEKVFDFSLNEKVQSEIDKYCIDYAMAPCNIITSWANMQFTGSSVTRHFHNRSIVSGCIYLGNYSIPLILHNPNTFQIWNGNDFGKFSYRFFKLENKKGSLVLFPSFIEHEAGEVSTNMKRFVMCFDT